MKQLDPKAVWLFFINNFITLAILGLIFSSWTGFIFPSTGTVDSLGYETVEFSGVRTALLLVIVLVLTYAVSKLTYHYYRYEMSDHVFKKEHGIIWKKYVSIPYDRIQNVDIYRGLLARILGLSDIQVQTAGGISTGSYGAFSEGRLIGVSREEAERLRDELLQKARTSRSGQGL